MSVRFDLILGEAEEMTNPKLDRYIETVAARLGALPEAERTEQIAELRQHLHSLVASAQAEGADEEAATEAALRQFGQAQEVGADLSRSIWRMRLKRLPENLVFALYVVSAVTLVQFGIRFGIHPLLRLLSEALLKPAATPHASLLYPHYLNISVIFGFAVFALLVGRDGVRRALKRFILPETRIGAAFYWICLNLIGSSLISFASVALFNFLIPKSYQWTSNADVLSLIASIIPAFLAGWVVSRRCGPAALPGVLSGMAALILMGLLNSLLRGWQISSDQPWLLIPYIKTTFTSLLFSLITVPFAVAPVMLKNVWIRRNHHEQTA